jgi:hypothetical protein
VNRRVVVAVTVLTGALWMLLVASDRVAGQAFWAKETPKLPMAKTWAAQKTKLPRYTPPRTPDGVPDLQGVWSGAGGDNNSFLEDHEFVDVTTPAQESFVSDPPDGKVPYTPWALARRQEMLAGLGRGWPGESKERLHASPGSYCLNVSPVFSFDGQEIVQKPGYVIMLSDDNYRVIPTDGRAAVNQNVKLWMGNSRGRWDGDTLVVEVTNFNGKPWLGGGRPPQTSSEALRIVERWSRPDGQTLEYQAVIEDPQMLTAPWTGPVQRRGMLPYDSIQEALCFPDPELYARHREYAASAAGRRSGGPGPGRGGRGGRGGGR